MKNNESHIKIREEVGKLLGTGLSIEEIAIRLNLPIGTRYIRGSAKWYKYCVNAKI